MLLKKKLALFNSLILACIYCDFSKEIAAINILMWLKLKHILFYFIFYFHNSQIKAKRD